METIGGSNNVFSGESGGPGLLSLDVFLLSVALNDCARAVQAGVGIFFQQEADGSVYVKTIVSNGSAERDGVAQVQF